MSNKHIHLSSIRVLIRGGGDLASGVAWRLHNCGFKVLVTEIALPLAVRRRVSFCEAVYEGSTQVEGVRARLIQTPDQAIALWKDGVIPVIVDPECASLPTIKPEVLVDAIIAKRNTGTSIGDAPLVIALGPGFQAGVDAHFVVETQRGHYLGRLITEGSAAPDSGIPGKIMGIEAERVIRAPAAGPWESAKEIGDMVEKGDLVGYVAGVEVKASIAGVIRGLIHPGITVPQGLKIGDIDPRGVVEHCFTISEKSLAIAGGVLEGILRTYASRPPSTTL